MWDMFKKVLLTVILLGLAIAVCVFCYTKVVSLTEEFYAVPTVESTVESEE